VDFNGSAGGRAGKDCKAEEPANGPDGGDSMLLKVCTLERNVGIQNTRCNVDVNRAQTELM